MQGDNPRRILAIKLADLGDLLLTEPALRSLRSTYPDARIDVLTTPAAARLLDLFEGDYRPLVFEKSAFDAPRALFLPGAAVPLSRFALTLRKAKYDAVAIFHHLTTPAGAIKFRALAGATGARVIAGLDNGRGTFLTHSVQDLGFGAKHEAEYMLEVAATLGASNVAPLPRLAAPGTDVPAFSGFQQRFAAVFPTTGPYAPARNWPVKSFADLARSLARDGLQPVVMGASDAAEAAQRIIEHEPSAVDLTGRTSLEDLAGIVFRATVVITGDSFPGHLARALDRPVVSIFGPSNHRAWKPVGAVAQGSAADRNAIIVRRDMPCSPCLYTGYRLGRRNGCPARTCLTSITPEMVLAAVRTAIGDGR